MITSYKPVYLVQVSRLYGGDAAIYSYLQHQYAERLDMRVPEHFMEWPMWAAIVAGKLQAYQPTFHVWAPGGELTLVQEFERRPGSVLGSVMDANFTEWLAITRAATEADCLVFLGGYVGEDRKRQLEDAGAVWVVTPLDLGQFFEWFSGDAAPDYGVFATPYWSQFNPPPRLTMSRGCLHDCAFCTISRGVTPLTEEEVWAQVHSWEWLSFEYIYLDDKTFGQAKNWRLLGEVVSYLKNHMRRFKGAIIQTTVPMLYKHAQEFAEIGVLVVEIGVEYPDDNFLAAMKKPYRTNQLLPALLWAKENGLQVVPNMLFGIEGQDYGTTIQWLLHHRPLWSWINPFILCAYEDGKGKLVGTEGDLDETSHERSWLTREAQARMGLALEVSMML